MHAFLPNVILFMLISLWVPSTVFNPRTVGGDPSLDGTISFQPNVIPELEIKFVEEFFRFEWKQNRFDLKLLINCEGKNLSLRDFWEKTDRQVKWQELVNKATESMYEFGYMIEDIPQEIADHVEYLVWKIEGASFDAVEIEVEEIQLFVEGYNITRFHLPDNLVLSYEDLWLYNFTVSHPNKYETIIKGVKGKTAWNLDPITFSDNTLTFADETTTTLSFDLWDASDTNEWGVVHNNDESNTQFQFDCKIVVGDGENITVASDKDVQITFSSSAVSLPSQALFEVKNNATFILGQLDNTTTKTVSHGCSIISNLLYGDTRFVYSDSNAENITVGLYGCSFTATSPNANHYHKLVFQDPDNPVKIYGCSLDNSHISLSDNLDIYDIYITRGIWGFVAPLTNTVIDKGLIKGKNYGFYVSGGNTVNISDTELKDITYYPFRGDAISADSYFTDCTYEAGGLGTAWIGGTGEIYIQYSFDLTVTYPNGSTMENANVTVKHYGQGESQDFTELTDANGQIATKTLTMGFYNQTGADTIYNYNPYNIEITNATGYQIYNSNFTLSEKTEWIIALTPEPYNWFAATIIIGIFACFMVIYALTAKT